MYITILMSECARYDTQFKSLPLLYPNTWYLSVLNKDSTYIYIYIYIYNYIYKDANRSLVCFHKDTFILTIAIVQNGIHEWQEHCSLLLVQAELRS